MEGKGRREGGRERERKGGAAGRVERSVRKPRLSNRVVDGRQEWGWEGSVDCGRAAVQENDVSESRRHMAACLLYIKKLKRNDIGIHLKAYLACLLVACAYANCAEGPLHELAF